MYKSNYGNIKKQSFSGCYIVFYTNRVKQFRILDDAVDEDQLYLCRMNVTFRKFN